MGIRGKACHSNPLFRGEDAFFTADKTFYTDFFSMMIVVALQNLVAYSVNMADNIMLGNYSQEALSGAATVNQIFFMVQQLSISFGNALVAIAAQYWGQKKEAPVRTLAGITISLGFASGLVIILICALMPRRLVGLFTASPAIIYEGTRYLGIIMWTFLLYFISQILMAALRVVGSVRISFYISLVSLVINVGMNYMLIFGRFGLPRLGIAGAGIGTLTARIAELVIVIIYIAFFEKKIDYLKPGLFRLDRELFGDYMKIYIPIFFATVLWGISVPVQTAILGHLSEDAIAANSVASTVYQYLKVVVLAMSSTSAVMIGRAIGKGDIRRVKSEARTMSVLDLIVGIVLAVTLILLKNPLLSVYSLSPEALKMADNLIVIMAVVMIGMSYQMPVSFGIIQGAGDARFTMKTNLICTWFIVMPLSFMAAFWWRLPVEWVVVIIQSDQIFKGIPVFIHFRKYKWIRRLTR